MGRRAVPVLFTLVIVASAARLGASQTTPPSAVRVRLEPAQITGAMTARQVLPVIRGTVARARQCYADVLAQNPTLQGSITIEMTVGPNGSVLGTQVRASIPALAPVAECVVEQSIRWQFPRGPASRGSVTILQEYELRPPT